MFATKLDLFSIGTIAIPIHTKPVPTLICIPNTIITESVLKQHVKSVGVLAMKLAIQPNIIQQHLLETFFHPKVGKMIVDETHA